MAQMIERTSVIDTFSKAVNALKTLHEGESIEETRASLTNKTYERQLARVISSIVNTNEEVGLISGKKLLLLGYTHTIHPPYRSNQRTFEKGIALVLSCKENSLTTLFTADGTEFKVDVFGDIPIFPRSEMEIQWGFVDNPNFKSKVDKK
jgi:hypothetical protein